MLEGMIPLPKERIDIRAKLLQWRESAGLTQRQLQKRSGINQTDISLIECGKRQNLTMNTVSALADALDITVQQFLFGDPKYPGEPSYDDGYAQALQDIRNFLLYKSQELEKVIHGRSKDRKIMFGLLNKVLLDPEAMDNFKRYGYKAKYRVYNDGTVAEIL